MVGAMEDLTRPITKAACPSDCLLLSLPDDAVAVILSALAAEHALLAFCLSSTACNAARRRENLPLISSGSLYVRRLRLLEWAVSSAGWLESVLHQSQGCVWAAECGCLPVILWLRGEGFWLCGEDCLAAAAGGGHVHILESLTALGCSADWRACAWAAAVGNLRTLQRARRLGMCWDEMTCANAAGSGALEVLQWARSPTWPTTTTTTTAAEAVSNSSICNSSICSSSDSDDVSPPPSPPSSLPTSPRRRASSHAGHLSPPPLLPSAPPSPSSPAGSRGRRTSSLRSSPPSGRSSPARRGAPPPDSTPAPWDSWTVAAAAGGERQ